MSVSKKIRALMVMQNKNNTDLAKHLNIAYSTINGKLHRESFTISEIIKIADFLDCELTFITKDGQKMPLTLDDLPENK